MLAAALILTPLLINEVCASNIDQWTDPTFNYGGWVEFYNPSDAAVNITGWYLSTDPELPRMARINPSTIVPAHGYKAVWMDHYHPRYSPRNVDMKLDTEGGIVMLSDPQGQVHLQQEYPEAVARCSWARTTDGGETWAYCANPSPNSSNNHRSYADRRLAAPQVAEDSQFFASGTCSVHVTIPEGCTLRYTTDGSAPTATNGLTSTSGIFSTTTTRIYRFRLFRDGYLPSAVVTRTCIRSDHKFDLPILSVVSTHRNLYSDSIGIFVRGGINGRPGNGQNTKCNWNMDWERPAAIQYFTPDGKQMLVDQEAGIERCGGWSRAWEPYSFKIKANKVYEGAKTIDYPFFAEKPYLRHKALQIRNGGNDNHCRVKDAFLQQIVSASGIDIDYQAYQPVAHFINGEWRGVINMREPNNKHFVYANYGLDDEEIDQFEMSPDSGYVQKCGTAAAWKRLISYAKSSANPSWYQRACELIDIDEYCNYMAVQLYLGNWDWPQNNLKAWRPIAEGGRFRFVLYDLDNSFDQKGTPFTTFADKQTYTFDYMYDLNTRYTREIEFVTLFVSLLNNADFRRRFIDAYCLVAYSVFDPTRSAAIINELAARVAPSQGLYHDESPWATASQLTSALSSTRQANMLNQLKNYAKLYLTNRSYQNANILADNPDARLTFNGQPIPHNQFKGRFFPPVTLAATAPAGYRFAGWHKLVTQNVALLSNDASWAYYDRGSLDELAWQQPDYDDRAWQRGAAPLGYFTDGNRTYRTILSYGGDKSHKRPTYYFRTTVQLAQSPNASDVFTLNYTVDDGCIVYVNGQEAARYNMPGGQVSYDTYATTYANGNPDNGSLSLPASLFRQGNNVIAVELHNNSASSTDVYWSASLTQVHQSAAELLSTETEYQLPSSSYTSAIACFEPDSHSDYKLPPVVINEVSAGNSIYINEYQKRNDWIELYNTTSHDIDLTGMYLTDRIDKPQKCMINAQGTQASAIIPAHGYKIVWCDKLATQSQLHASFKLDNDGVRQVMLTAADGSWSDTLTYCLHDGLQTVGRYPDGARTTYLLSRPTICQANKFSSYATAVQSVISSAIQQVEANLPTDNSYCIYDLSGRQVSSGQGTITTLRNLPTGIYIVRTGNESYVLTHR